MEPAWDAQELTVQSDTSRTARYRRLQSWFREMVLGARPGKYTPRGGDERPCGSLLHPDDVAHRPGLNFLDDRIDAYATERAEQVRGENGTLDAYRLRHNMPSSMPMCFNLFGVVRETPAARLPFMQTLFDPAASDVELVECEWTPREPGSTINDRTAFDTAIVTRRSGGTRHLIGVETKYTERFSPTRYGAPDRPADAGKYRSIHEQSGWFDPAQHDSLTASSTNQLWRNCLLAAAAERSGEFTSAEVVVVSLEDDQGARTAVTRVSAAMTDSSRCRSVPLERIAAESWGIPPLAGWAERFEQRYLDLEPVR